MKFINLTPHTINLPNKVIEPSGLARCMTITEPAGQVDGIELITRTFGQVTGLPDPEPDTLYIVSMPVRDALPNRHDLASPGDLIRNEKGDILAAKNLVVNK